MGGVGGDDFTGQSKKRRSRKDKQKQDDLQEGEMPEQKKKRKKKQTDPLTTTNQQTEFGTTNPTQKDLIWATLLPMLVDFHQVASLRRNPYWIFHLKT